MHVHISQCRFCAIDSSAECRYLSEISSVSNVWQSHLFCDRPKNEIKRIQLLTFRFVQPISPTGMIVRIVVFIYRLCYHFPCCLPTFLLTVLAKSNIGENTDADMTISAPSLWTFRQRLIPFLPRPRFLTLSLIPVKLFPVLQWIPKWFYYLGHYKITRLTYGIYATESFKKSRCVSS